MLAKHKAWKARVSEDLASLTIKLQDANVASDSEMQSLREVVKLFMEAK